MHLVASVSLSDRLFVCLYVGRVQQSQVRVNRLQDPYQSEEFVCVSVVRGAYNDYIADMFDRLIT